MTGPGPPSEHPPLVTVRKGDLPKVHSYFLVRSVEGVLPFFTPLRSQHKDLFPAAGAKAVKKKFLFHVKIRVSKIKWDLEQKKKEVTMRTAGQVKVQLHLHKVKDLTAQHACNDRSPINTTSAGC